MDTRCGTGLEPVWPTEIDEYRLIRPLGNAPVPRAFLAHDRRLDRPVVLRLVRPLVAWHSTDAERMVGARALARIQHPHLCRIHRVREGKCPYVVSDYLRGQPLSSSELPMEPARALAIGRALADAVVALHAAGVTHGYINSESVILGADNAPYLTGITKARAFAKPHGAAARRTDVRALLLLLAQLVTENQRSQVLGRWARSVADPDAFLPTAEELRSELEILSRPSPLGNAELAAGPTNPYRGLRSFDSEHRALFFGRQTEVEALLERLSVEPWVVVAGRSGTGKSSLVKAGLAPAIAAGQLGEQPRWDIASMVPGIRPIEALATVLAPIYSTNPEQLAHAMRQRPLLPVLLARKRAGAGLLLLVDQFEELATITDPAERMLFLTVLSRFGTLIPGVRTVIAMRSDYLARLTEIQPIGNQLIRATFLLPPMTEQGMWQAATAPARAYGYEFASQSIVESLIKEAKSSEAGLALLSFALAQLWEARDPKKNTIPTDALDRLGGLAGALARHADIVLSALHPSERREARRLLLSLVTREETRGRRLETEIVNPDSPYSRKVLDALVNGRLVVAGESATTSGSADGRAASPPATSYELAHEALINVWPRLRAWLDEASDARMAATRLVTTAKDWDHLGRGNEGLYGPRQLADLDASGALEQLEHRSVCRTEADEAAGGVAARSEEGAYSRYVTNERRSGCVPAASLPTGGKPFGALETGSAAARNDDLGIVAAFLAASRRSVRVRHGLRMAAMVIAPLLASLLALSVTGAQRLHHRALVDGVINDAVVAISIASTKDRESADLRAAAIRHFEQSDALRGESLWQQAHELAESTEAERTRARRLLDRALAHDPRHRTARRLIADLTLASLVAADEQHDSVLAATLRSRLELYDDDGSRRAQLSRTGSITIASTPPANLTLLEYQKNSTGRLEAERPRSLGSSPTTVKLAPGSYLVVAKRHGYLATNYPLKVKPDEELQLEILLPRNDEAPDGYAFVPAGRSIYGSESSEAVRRYVRAQPAHEVDLPAFLIGRTEVTCGDYLQYLRAIPLAERNTYLIGGLSFTTGGKAQIYAEGHTVVEGELLCQKAGKQCRDWLRLPIRGASRDDAAAYAAWLAKSGKLPGARLCSDREWERAARGADGRRYPHGSTLLPADACTLAEFDGKQADARPCEVGAHPQSRSVFGVDDLVGNLPEWVADAPSLEEPSLGIMRGGSYSSEQHQTWSTYRAPADSSARGEATIRVCANK
ncbi:MAG: SUMF1/EgtB/PvdO family nonheme iron enzyme [Pseudomonadota bacterium]